MRHARMFLVLAAIASMGFTCAHQFQTVKLLDGQRVQTISRELINFPEPGTDFVYLSEWTCPKGEGKCVKTGQAFGSSETLVENLLGGAAVGAFFPLIRPSNNTSTAIGGAGGDAVQEQSQAVRRERRRPREREHYGGD